MVKVVREEVAGLSQDVSRVEPNTVSHQWPLKIRHTEAGGFSHQPMTPLHWPNHLRAVTLRGDQDAHTSTNSLDCARVLEGEERPVEHAHLKLRPLPGQRGINFIGPQQPDVRSHGCECTEPDLVSAGEMPSRSGAVSGI